MDRDRFSLLHPLRVRWNECDPHGVVFNANYFMYYDVAMYEWQRAVGYSHGEKPDFLTVHAECDFKGSAHFDQELEIAARCASIGTKSMDLECAIFRGEELLNQGKLTYVYIESASRRAVPIPAHFVERVVAFERLRPVIAARPVGMAGQR
ncbi:MAG: acyl-CoA thioesterase [Dehalococcoidia bacterium]